MPDSKLIFYKGVPITKEAQVIFKSKENQTEYFKKYIHVIKDLDDAAYMYLRKGTSTIKVKAPLKELEKVDYLSFCNPSYEDRIYYAKVVNVEYINDNTTEVMYGLDVFQTYMFDVSYGLSCYVERQGINEYDYNKIQNNPYDVSVYQMSTPENLEMNESVEKFYTGTDLKQYPDQNINDVVILMYVSNFDTSDMAAYADFVKLFNVFILPDGTITDLETGTVSYLGINAGRAYTIYGIKTKLSGVNRLENLTKAIDILTGQGVDSLILGIYQISEKTFEAYKKGIDNLEILPPSLPGVDPKLLRFPYTYIRVENNEGGVKEYKFEDFAGMRYGTSKSAEFSYLSLLDGQPTAALFPINYKMHGENEAERMDANLVPQIGYTTDAYLTFVASQYENSLRTRTNTYGENISERLDKMGGGKRSIWGLARDYGWDAFKGARNYINKMTDLGQGLVKSGAGAVTDFLSLKNGNMNAAGSFASNLSGVSTGLTQMGRTTGDALIGAAEYASGMQAGRGIRDEIYTWRSGGNVADSDVYGPAKAAFVRDDYHAGAGNGTLGYFIPSNKHAPLTFRATTVHLDLTVAEVYTNYFELFGYAENRITDINAITYIQKGSSDYFPHFNQTRFGLTTYVKTRDIKITFAQQWIADQISEMFNSGIILIKGDDDAKAAD